MAKRIGGESIRFLAIKAIKMDDSSKLLCNEFVILIQEKDNN
jgi:hypothetical protein